MITRTPTHSRCLSRPLRVATFNVAGIRSDLRRRNLFRFLRTLNLDIIALQETHAPLDSSRWTREWGAPALWTPHLGLLFSRSIVLRDSSSDFDTRVLFATVTIDNLELNLANIYA